MRLLVCVCCALAQEGFLNPVDPAVRFVSPSRESQAVGFGGLRARIQGSAQAEEREEEAENCHHCDYFSSAALVTFFVLSTIFWGLCFGYEFKCLPEACQCRPTFQGSITKMLEELTLKYWLFLLLNIWVWGGALFYYFHNEWTFAQSFYYSAQAGWSVGFGALTEPDEWSMIYTIFHVCVGASFISAAVAIFTHRAQARSLSREAENWKVISSGEFKNFFASDVKYDDNTIKAKFLLNDHVFTILMFIFWITMGALFAHLKWGATLIEGVYFSVTAVSTGGFYAPETDVESMWFTGFFVLLGVPIFGKALGLLADILVAPIEEAENELKLLNFRLGHKEWKEAAGNDGNMTYEEFLKMVMKSYYGVSEEQLGKLKEKFDRYDDDNDGIITMAERLKYKANSK